MKAIYLELSDKDLDEILRQHFLNKGFDYGGSQRRVEAEKLPPMEIQLYVDDIGGLRND